VVTAGSMLIGILSLFDIIQGMFLEDWSPTRLSLQLAWLVCTRMCEARCYAPGMTTCAFERCSGTFLFLQGSVRTVFRPAQM